MKELKDLISEVQKELQQIHGCNNIQDGGGEVGGSTWRGRGGGVLGGEAHGGSTWGVELRVWFCLFCGGLYCPPTPNEPCGDQG